MAQGCIGNMDGVVYGCCAVSRLCQWRGGGEPSLPRKDPYTASGRVVDGESKGIPGVLIYYGDTGTVVESDSDGYWVITNLTDTVVVTPIKEGFGVLSFEHYSLEGDSFRNVYRL